MCWKNAKLNNSKISKILVNCADYSTINGYSLLLDKKKAL